MENNQIATPQVAEVSEFATRKSLAGKVPEPEVNKFLASLKSQSVPAPIEASASVEAFIKGSVTCKTKTGHNFKGDFWGAGVGSLSSPVGFLYTAYNSWEAFFNEVTSCHAQGIGEVGGVLQINFFNKNGVPVGQYNGVAVGAGVFEGGGAGSWH